MSRTLWAIIYMLTVRFAMARVIAMVMTRVIAACRSCTIWFV